MIDPTERLTRTRLALKGGDVAILCEGRDEVFVVKHLAKQMGCDVVAGIKEEHPKITHETELRALTEQAVDRKARAIGVVFDAEQSRDTTAKRIGRMFEAAGLKMPQDELKLTKSVSDEHLLKAAYLINPAGRATGCLESLFIPQVQGHALWPCLDDMMTCYREQLGKRAGSRAWADKVVLRAYIAHKCPGNTGVRPAVEDGILTCDTPEFDPIRRLLELLCQ
jgi:hypothetical protein